MTRDHGPSVGAALEADHQRIDEHFARFAASLTAGAADAEAFRAGADGLRHHIFVEEELYFPPLREAGLVGPVMVMLREHGQIWDLLEELEQGSTAGDPAAALAPAWERLAAVLTAHNLKEERILYPAGDGILAPEPAASITESLTSAATPDGWEPEMAGLG